MHQGLGNGDNDDGDDVDIATVVVFVTGQGSVPPTKKLYEALTLLF